MCINPAKNESEGVELRKAICGYQKVSIFSAIRALTGQVLVFFSEVPLTQCLSVRRWIHISVVPKAMTLRRTTRAGHSHHFNKIWLLSISSPTQVPAVKKLQAALLKEKEISVKKFIFLNQIL